MTRIVAAAAAVCWSLAGPLQAAAQPPRPAAQPARPAAQPARPSAQSARPPAPSARDGRLVVTVVDQTGAVLPRATVKVLGIEPATSKPIDPVEASEQGVASIPGLAPGRYSVQAEFPGFETSLVRDTRVRAGDNRITITLALERMSDSVTVAQDTAQAAADPHGSSFGTALTPDQIDALSDDPDTLAQQLSDLGGPDATIRVDSFEGGQLPPKSQIKSIHVTRDGFAAENHSAGQIFVEVVTQPGVGPLRGGLNTRFRDSALSGRNQIAQVIQPERVEDANLFLGGSLVRNRASFSLQVGGTNQFNKPIQNIPGQTALIIDQKQKFDRLNLYGTLDYAITKDQTLRLSYSQFGTTNNNLGIGQYDQPERAYANENHQYQFRAQEVGPLGRRFFANTRLSVNVSDSSAHSAVEAPTIVVQDAFTIGGAQRTGGQYGKTFTVASDVDYIRGIHSVRTGILMDGGWYRSDNSTNYLGTYTFASLDDYQAGRAENYKIILGSPVVSYFSMQGGIYVQDDIRVRKNLTLSPGVRYEMETHLKDNNAVGPRFGVTWAPTKSGHTTLRASTGIFYDWLIRDTFEQTLRVDGFHQQQVNVSAAQACDASGTCAIADPVPYPNPGVLVGQPSDRYLLSPGLHFIHYRRVSAGVDQTISRKLRVSTTYAYVLGDGRWRGENLNAPVDGIRPDPAFANVIQVVDDAGSTQHQLITNVQYNLAGNLAPPSPFSQTGPRVNWKRLNIQATYTLGRSRDNTDNRFVVPPSGDVNTEWGPSLNDVRHRLFMSISSQQIRNFNANVNINATSAPPYNITTGFDDNGDGSFNDRPVGMSRNNGRGSGQFTANAQFSYTFAFGRSTVPGVQGVGVQAGPGGSAPVVTTFTGAPPRYRLVLLCQIFNLTNHANYVGYSGVLTSPFYAQPTGVSNPRKIDVGVAINF